MQDIANKVNEAVAADITPILCVDRDMVVTQLAALGNSDREHVVLAYAPEEAESLEIARHVANIAETAAYFREISGGCPVLYGGGVHAGNVGDLIALPSIAGVLTASGSLDPHAFIKLVENARGALS